MIARRLRLTASILIGALLALAACSGPEPVVQNAPSPTCAPAPHTPTTPPGPVANYRDGSTYDC